MEKKGFTLIELLIVIAIIVVLSVVVIITINPAQILRQARDSQRISDLGTIRTALSFYLSDVLSPAQNALGNSSTCYISTAPGVGTTTAGCGRMASGDTTIVSTTAANANKVDGTGWIKTNFSAISTGAPFGTLPIDPVNNATYFYSYATNAYPNFQFEIDADMESTRYASSGPSDVESTDGGDNVGVYEVGTDLAL